MPVMLHFTLASMCLCVCLHLNVVYSSNCWCKEVRVSRLQAAAP